MNRNIFKRFQLFLWLWVISILLLNGGCYHSKESTTKKFTALPVSKVVFVGFLPAMSHNDEPGVFLNPLSGSAVTAEPVPPEVVEEMSDMLFERVVKEKGFELVSRSQAIGVYSTIVASNQNVGMQPLEVVQEVGKTFEADAVLVGYMYRWGDREGGDYAAGRPASVAFDLHLIKPSDGAVLWKSKFDKTQQPLSENVFGLRTFFRSKGRWMTADELATIGLEKLLEEMPSAEK